LQHLFDETMILLTRFWVILLFLGNVQAISSF